VDKIDSEIMMVLNDKKYKARTIYGVAKALDIRPEAIVSRLANSRDLNQQVKIYPIKSKKGDVLITSRDRFDRSATLRERFIDIFATKRVVIK
jgi:hypothetical protein